MAVRRKARSRSRLAWAGLTVVPWALAGGLLVSMGAEAGQEPMQASTRVGLTDAGPAMPGDLVPLAAATEGAGFALPPGDLLAVGAAPAADEVEPRIAMKAGGSPGVVVDRAPRRDPAVPVRPTFAARLGAAGALARFRAAAAAFGPGDEGAEGAGFAAVPVDSAWADPSRLQPLPHDLPVTTRRTRSANSPQAEAGSTTPHAEDGSTPPVGRAVSLASTTPALADGTPIEIAALPKFSRGPHGLITGDRTVVGVAQVHPDYAALLDRAKSAPEQRCLAQAVYFEARSEPEEGQAAVAQVVLNRATSGLYPGSVCGVVFQNQQRRNACQFSFTCEGHALRVSEGESWNRAVRIAREVTDGTTYVSDVGGATHYHATYVRPGWARALTRTEAIGHHIFYTLKPGQT
ncbi:cell wall hydrolase [Lichenibacterium minor]|uniref:Cell wall hydrolase n=2 Tax=Lichenibacterium minor TaxID=2316528 RepID=A0A4Q2U3Q4_9HYPH|nr:cell wall hydrolase [Lichenibacterium minor]